MQQALASLWTHRQIAGTLLARQLRSRYQGSLLGWLWLFVAPLFMLCIYAFVFGEVLQARWQLGTAGASLPSFAVILFSGLLVHQFFSECLTTAPQQVLDNPNFVKKVIFPLELLPWISMLSAGSQALFSVGILLLAVVVLGGTAHWSWLALPLVYLPLVLVALGLSWLLAALGVFVRDLKQIVGFVSVALLFLSPVFYPMSELPERLQFMAYANPLAIIIEQSRQVIFGGIAPNWWQLGAYLAIALPFSLTSLWFFQRCKGLYADVM